MQVTVQSIHFDADVKLINFVQDKMKKLATFHDRIINGEVFLRLDRNDINENKIAEIRVIVPGRELFARKQCKTFEEAADTAVDALRKQIQKYRTQTNQSS